MRTSILTLLIAVFCVFAVSAQSYHFKYYNPVDLYEGVDQNFYTESSFGIKNPVYAAYPVSDNIRFNRVDGLFIGLQEDKMNWDNGDFLGLDDIDVHGLLGYSTTQNNLQYTVGAEKSIGDSRKWLLLGGELYNATATEDYWRTGSYENSISMFAAGFDFYDYFKSDGFGFYGIIKPVRSIELAASYNVSEFSTLKARTDFSLFSRYSTFRPNPAIDSRSDQISQEYVTLGVTLNPDGISDEGSLSATVSAKAELSDLGGLNNDFYYNSYQIEAKTYLRLDRSTLIKWRMMAGGITGNAPEFKNFAMGGIGSMRALGYKAMQGNQMLLSNLELQFGQSSSHNNGWPDLSSTTISLFLDSGTANFNDKLYSASDPLRDFDLSMYDMTHNVGLGLGLGMMRLEIAKPVAGADGQSVFWIRLNPTF